MDPYTKWSEFFTTATAARREPTRFGKLLESQGLSGKVQTDTCAQVQFDTAVPTQQYVNSDDSVVQPAPSTAKGLALLLCANPDHENFMRQTGLSSMTVPISVPVIFEHQPTVDALVAHLEDELARSPDKIFFLPNKAAAVLHATEQSTIFHTEAADEGEFNFHDNFSTQPADASVAAARFLSPATAAAQHQRESAFISALEILAGPKVPETREEFEEPGAVFLEDNKIRPRIQSSRWLRNLQPSVYQKDTTAQMRMTFVTCRAGMPQILRCLITLDQF